MIAKESSTVLLNYQLILNQFEKYLNKNKPTGAPEYLYEASNHILQSKGKRIRPMLCLLSGEMFGTEIEKLMPAGLAVELYHNSTLVHDDIMDNALLRRSKPTTHTIYGNSNAINAGNLLTNLAYQSISKYPEKIYFKLMQEFNKVCIEIIEGQAMDIHFETAENVSKNEYLEMIKLKTSVLLASSCKMGAIIAEATTENQEKAYQFGLNLGLSFQLKDDYLDAFGEADLVGKKRGGDILQNKKTLLAIETISLANSTDLKKYHQYQNIENEDDKVDAILELMEKTGAKAKVELLMEEYFEKAMQYMLSIELSDSRKADLRELAHLIYHREF